VDARRRGGIVCGLETESSRRALIFLPRPPATAGCAWISELRTPKTIVVVAPFFRNFSGDTPQVHDVLMLTQFNGVWAQTPSQALGGFANLTSQFVRRDCLWTGQAVRNALFAIVSSLRFDNKIIPDDDLRKRIFTALEILLRLSTALLGDFITELELQECEKLYVKFGEVLKQTDFVTFRAKGTDFVKYFNYKVLIDDVRQYGMPLGFATESIGEARPLEICLPEPHEQAE
jgi:hypothetical protein